MPENTEYTVTEFETSEREAHAVISAAIANADGTDATRKAARLAFDWEAERLNKLNEER